MRYVAFFILLFSFAALMGTEIYGVIDEDTTIGPEGNPWYVPYNLTVSENSTLTILPGTEIYITAAYTDDYSNFVASGNNEAVAKTINIYGSLVAVGTESDSILFTRYPDYPDYRWGGMRIMNEHPENSRFEYCKVNYSAFIHDDIQFGSCGISTKPGMTIKYCRFQDNYFSIRIFDYDSGEYYPSLIYGCSFYSTEDRFLYYNGEYDDGILLQIDAPDEETVIAYCEFDSLGLDLRRGKNYVIHNNFNNINNNNAGIVISENQDFYGNYLENSNNYWNIIAADADNNSVFRKNTFVNFNPSPNPPTRIFILTYNDISDNIFCNSKLRINLKPNNKFYNNTATGNAYIDLHCDHENSELTQVYNNFAYNASISFYGYGSCYFYNNIFYGEDSGSAIILLNGNNDFYGFNNYTDYWSLRASYLNEGEAVNYYNNIFNDLDNFVEDNPQRYNRNFYNNFLTYNIPEYVVDCGGNLEDMDIALAGVVIDTLNHSFALTDSSLCIDAGYPDTTFCLFDYSYNFSPFDGDGDGFAVVDIGPVEYGSYFTIGYVKCTITDPEGVPLDIIRGEVAGECVEYTGLDGSFVMALPEGTYNLVLDSPFYVRDSLFVAVSVTDTSFVNMSLEACYPFVDTNENELPVVNGSKLVCYPNPFNPELTIAFFTTEITESTEINIYNVKGQKVKSLVNAVLSAGEHSVVWQGKDDKGRQVSSGLYLVRGKIGGREVTKKALLLK